MQDITASDLPGADGMLRRSVLRVLAWVQAGLAHLHYGYLDWISRMAVPFTATAEFLEGWAALKGVLRKPASPTGGTLTFAAADGSVIPDATPVLRSDGTQYVTVGSVTASGGSAVVTVEAMVDGSAGNFDGGSLFTLGVSIAGVTLQSSASAQTTAGTDVELDDSLRTRMLRVYAAPPQGGDRNDYIEWATAVPDVTRAWVNANGMGPGTVVVYTMLDAAEAAHGGFPQGANGVAAAETRDVAATGDQLAVANAIFPVQPVTALVYSSAPIASPVAFTITDLGANNTAAMQTAIGAALADMFVRLGNVGGTVDPMSGAAWPAIEPSDWYAALDAIPGLVNFNVTVPAVAITPSAGNLFTVGALTFVA
jgi:uncharacterized phage protein gp47/JayE